MKQAILILSFLCLTLTLGFAQQKAEPKKTNVALLIIDIQNDYFENGANPLVNSDKACLNTLSILDKFRTDSLPVIYIQHLSMQPKATFFIPDTKGAEIRDNIKPQAQEKVIVKHYPNSFRETELLDYLKSKNITDLVVCGMMTHMCVDATTRAAKDFGFNITLIGDACATRDLEINGKIIKSEDVHNSFLAALKSGYANVITAKEYLSVK